MLLYLLPNIFKENLIMTNTNNFNKMKEKKDIVHGVPLQKIYDVVTDWMKKHPKDMEILSK